MKSKEFRLVLGRSTEATRVPAREERKTARIAPPRPALTSAAAIRALKATPGSKEMLDGTPALGVPAAWTPVAYFSVCQKTGTATYLDIWDADHFDYFTDMQRDLTDCRVWFSDQGFAYWNSPQTHTGRVNCYFRAPVDGTYVCNVMLQSYGGPATVECLIDSFDFGPLPFTGTIVQPHVSWLNTGYHAFRINQLSGSYFFVNLMVWQVA